MLCGSLDGRGIWGRMDTRICMAESLRCSPEIIMTLLVNRLYPITKSKVSLKIKQNIRVQRWHSSSQKRGNLPLLSPGSESAWFSLLLHSSWFPELRPFSKQDLAPVLKPHLWSTVLATIPPHHLCLAPGPCSACWARCRPGWAPAEWWQRTCVTRALTGLREPRAACLLCVQLSQACPTLWPHGLQPARLLCPWDSPGKNIGVGAMPSPRGSSRPRDWTHICYNSYTGRQVLYH